MLLRGLSPWQEYKICMVGLDNAGKTSILYRMSLGLSEIVRTYPTIGSNVEQLEIKNVRLRVWDLGGQEDLRQTWSLHFMDTKALIMVVDSTDFERIDLARQELHRVLSSEELQDAAVLVFANKQDQRSCMGIAEMTDALQLDRITTRKWRIQPSSAVSGEGLKEGFSWVVESLRST